MNLMFEKRYTNRIPIDMFKNTYSDYFRHHKLMPRKFGLVIIFFLSSIWASPVHAAQDEADVYSFGVAMGSSLYFAALEDNASLDSSLSLAQTIASRLARNDLLDTNVDVRGSNGVSQRGLWILAGQYLMAYEAREDSGAAHNLFALGLNIALVEWHLNTPVEDRTLTCRAVKDPVKQAREALLRLQVPSNRQTKVRLVQALQAVERKYTTGGSHSACSFPVRRDGQGNPIRQREYWDVRAMRIELGHIFSGEGNLLAKTQNLERHSRDSAVRAVRRGIPRP